MELQRWKELLRILESGSLTAASEQLGYTLSGLSRSMAALEKETGFQLLNRGRKGVQPTKECEKLLPYIQELLYASERLYQEVASVRGGEEGVISIGTAYRHYYRWLTKVTSGFHELHPGVNFRIYHGTSTEFADKLRKHQLDFCLISKRADVHCWYPICQDPLVAVVPANHPLALEKEIPLDVFEREPYIETCSGMDIDSGRFFQKYRIQPNVQFATGDIQATYAMIDAGMGLTVTNQINSLSSYDEVCHRPVVPTEVIELGLACGENLPSAAQKFLEFVLPQLPD